MIQADILFQAWLVFVSRELQINFCAGVDPRLSELGLCVWNFFFGSASRSRHAMVRGSSRPPDARGILLPGSQDRNVRGTL
jgi:hypothetical protein